MAGLIIIAKLALFWWAVMGLDDALRRLLPEGALARTRLPRAFCGLSVMMLIPLLLGAVGLLASWLLLALTLAFALLAVPRFMPTLRRLQKRVVSIRNLPEMLLWLLALFLIASNALRALRPHGFVDPLIVYAVRPDKWLAAGSLVPFAQSKFVGFPFLGELLATWPAAMSAGRIEQLALLQLFQSSMLAAAAFTAAGLMQLGRRSYPIGVSAVLGLPLLASWSSVAKTDMTALYFVTVAFSLFFFDVLKNKGGSVSPTAWVACGIAMGTKYSVLPAVGVLIIGALFVPGWRSRLAAGLVLAAVIPLGFSIRNLLLTGSPLYPYLSGIFSAGSEWELIYPEAVQQVRLRAGRPLLACLLSLLKSWRSAGLLFTLGIAALAAKRRFKPAAVIASVVICYAIASSIIFNPMPWGAKYAVLIAPAMACLGIACVSRSGIPIYLSLTVLTSIVVFLSELPQRLSFLHRAPSTLNRIAFRGTDVPPTLGLHIWINGNLPTEAKILSLWRPERYFCERELIVAQNSPLGLRLFSSASNLQQEVETIRNMGVDYVYFQADDPLPADLEANLAVLDPLVLGHVLIPVAEVDGYIVCKINSEPATIGGPR